MNKSFKELFDRINSCTGLIFLNTFEETRVVREIKKEFPEDSIQFWSATQGMHEIKKHKDSSKDIDYEQVKLYKYKPTECRKTPDGKTSVGKSLEPALKIIEEDSRNKIKDDMNQVEKNIYILRDADIFFKNPLIERMVRDMIYLAGAAGNIMIITGPGIRVPDNVSKDSAYIELTLPTAHEISEDIIKERIVPLIENNNIEIDNGNGKDCDKLDSEFDIDEITRACMGLTEDEIINSISYSLTVHKSILPSVILEEKRQIINKNDVLEYFNCDDQLKDVGGFKELKEWFGVQRKIMDNPDHAAKYFANQPKGILILGLQGSGKTYMCKAMAKAWAKGMIKLDMGKVYDGLVGSSEKNCRMALAQAVAVGGIILIDEMDKSLAGAGSSDKTDGGTTKRVISTLLEWMSEPHPGTFIVATANDIGDMMKAHPELFRKGRFDEMWFSDAPSIEERKEIFKIHLTKCGVDINKIDIDKLSKKVYIKGGKEYQYTGAEIEHSIKEAKSHNFAKRYKGKELKPGTKLDIGTNEIIDHLDKIIPITKIAENTINKSRKWASDNARNVSSFNTEIKIKDTIISGEITELSADNISL